MTNHILSIILLFAMLFASCKTVHKPHNYTQPRKDQERWVVPEQTISTMRDLVRRYQMATQQPSVTNDLAVHLRITYSHISLGNTDRDAGLRVLHFTGELLKDCGGTKELWFAAVNLAKKPDPKTIGPGADPIPQEFIPKW